MADTIDLAGHGMLAVSRLSLAALRDALLRDLGPGAAGYIQEAGYAGGEAVWSAFGAWLAGHGRGRAEDLPLEAFERAAAEFFAAAGWGTLRIGSSGDSVATLDTDDWGEADPRVGLDQPGCHYSTGMFADFFGRVAEAPLAVLEVECRSTGAARCRFLVGNADVMEHLYEEMGRGADYESALASLVPAEG